MYINPKDQVIIQEWAEKANVSMAEIVHRLVKLALNYKEESILESEEKKNGKSKNT